MRWSKMEFDKGKQCQTERQRERTQENKKVLQT